MKAINISIFILLSALYVTCSYDNEPSLTSEIPNNVDFKVLVHDYDKTLENKYGGSIPIIKKGLLGIGELETTIFRNKYGVTTISYLFSGKIEGFENLQFRRFNAGVKNDLKSLNIKNINYVFICFIGNQFIIYNRSTGDFNSFYVESNIMAANKTPQLNTTECYSLIITTGNTFQSLRDDSCECECHGSAPYYSDNILLS